MRCIIISVVQEVIDMDMKCFFQMEKMVKKQEVDIIPIGKSVFSQDIYNYFNILKYFDKDHLAFEVFTYIFDRNIIKYFAISIHKIKRKIERSGVMISVYKHWCPKNIKSYRLRINYLERNLMITHITRMANKHFYQLTTKGLIFGLMFYGYGNWNFSKPFVDTSYSMLNKALAECLNIQFIKSTIKMNKRTNKMMDLERKRAERINKIDILPILEQLVIDGKATSDDVARFLRKHLYRLDDDDLDELRFDTDDLDEFDDDELKSYGDIDKYE